MSVEPRVVKSHRETVARYMEAIRRGRIPAGRRLRQAVERQLRDVERAKKRGAEYYFDEEAAAAAIEFFPLLVHTTGQFNGQAFVLRDFQKFMVWLLMGWKRKDNHMRRFRTLLYSVGRGNGKSPFAAALALLLTFFGGEARAEGYCVATKLPQARIAHREAQRFVSRSPGLKDVIESQKDNLNCPETDSTLVPIASDGKSADGFVTHVALLDEVHAWREQHRDLYDKLLTSMGKRTQPLTIIITTAGDDKSVIWLEVYDSACRVLDGSEQDDTLLAVIFEADRDDSIDEVATWAKANPMLLKDGARAACTIDPDSPVKLVYLQSETKKALSNAVKENRFRRYHLNQKVTSTERPIRHEDWVKLTKKRPDLAGLTAFVGFDLGRSNDFAAWTAVFPFDETIKDVKQPRRYFVISRSYTCDDRSELIDTEQIRGWVANGLLTSHPGDAVDFNAIQADLVELAQLYHVLEFGHDPMFATHTAQNLLNDFGLPVIKLAQSYKNYNEPVRELLRVVAAGRIEHDGDEVLAWQIANLEVKKNAMDLWMPHKGKSTSFKIDGAVSLLMGLGGCLFHERAAPGQDLRTIFH